MNPEELQKQIALYYSKLPAELQTVFANMKWLEALKQISVKFGLTEDQIQNLGTETTLVLLGIIHNEEYTENIKKLNLTPENTEKIMAEINDQVLGSLKPELENAFYKNVEELSGKESNITEELDERFNLLDKDTQKIIIDMGYHEKIYNIATANKLDIPTMGRLEAVTTDVIVGKIHGEDFSKEIKYRLDMKDDLANKLEGEINEQILKPIKMKMESSYVRKPEVATYFIKQEVKAPMQIKIVKPDLSIPELSTGMTEPEITDGKTIPTPAQNPTPSILAQKLAGTTKSTEVKTDYSLNNLSNKKVEPTEKVHTAKADPYRLSPNE